MVMAMAEPSRHGRETGFVFLTIGVSLMITFGMTMGASYVAIGLPFVVLGLPFVVLGLIAMAKAKDGE